MTDPTITIAGLEARIKCLVAALRSANTGRAEAATLDSAACGYNAQLRTERDALAAQLAEVRAKLDAAPRVCAIHSYEHGPGPCMTCGAWPPGTRELIAACRTRIAGLEQAANERSRTPCNGSCDIALASRQVGPDGIVPRNARECAELWEREAARLWHDYLTVVDAIMPRSDGPEHAAATARSHRRHIAELETDVAQLTARVAELEARPVLTEAKLHEAWGEARGGAYMVPDIMRHLCPVTLPAQDRAEELTQAIHGTPREEVNPAIWRGMVERTRSALATLGAPPTSPPAARPVFAGVSVEELAAAAHNAECDHMSEDRPGDVWPFIVRAVLARLEVSLVTDERLADVLSALPVWRGERMPWQYGGARAWAADLIARLAAGIPVTPEVGK